ncbi:MAG: hypothetical protein JOZ24_07385 [Candidatus Eremiobacteraeota bacterium]|nr:hypothetical protein [Candidatus Eremiobacteraeota bacterium]
MRAAVEAAIASWTEPLRADDRFDVLGPAPYPVARVNEEWRYRVAVRTKELDALRATLRAQVLPAAARLRGVRLAISFEA